MAYRLSELADRDLDEICDWIAADSPAASEKVLDALRATFEFLSRHPRVGAVRNDLSEEVRVFAGMRPAQRYVIFFRPAEVELEIVRVLHGSRDFTQAFRD